MSDAPLTTARDDAVLVVVDVQERLAATMKERESVIAAVLLLASAARRLSVPVIVTRQYPKGLGDLVAEVAEALSDVPPVDKVAFSCLAEPAFRERLVATGRRQVVLAGMETHICVAQTALALRHEGWQVFVVADAVCSRVALDHEMALDRLRAAGVTVTTAEAAVYELLGRAATDEFTDVLQAVKRRSGGV